MGVHRLDVPVFRRFKKSRVRVAAPPCHPDRTADISERPIDIENLLILGNDPAGPLKQDPQLGISGGRTVMSQNHALNEVFTHKLHRHRTRARVHFPHVRHYPKSPR